MPDKSIQHIRETKGDLLHTNGVAVFHDPKTQQPIVLNAFKITRLSVSNREPFDTMVHYGNPDAWLYVQETVNDATRIWVNALNGITDFQGI